MGRSPSRGYWASVALLIPFGVVTGFSIGIPFLLLGILLAALAPVRDRPAAFWPPLIGLVVFVATYLVLAPLGCSSVSSDRAASRTTCRSLIGLDYSGGAGYQAPLGPALLAGLGAAVVMAIVVFALLRWRQSATASGDIQPNGM